MMNYKRLHGCLLLFMLFTGMWLSAATLYVTNSNNSGSGSLRAMVSNANSGDRIEFSLSGIVTITLISEIEITKSITIVGNGIDTTRISGGNANRIFYVNSSSGEVSIQHLTIIDGYAGSGAKGSNGNLTSRDGEDGELGGHGGAIYNESILNMDFVKIQDSNAGDGGDGGFGKSYTGLDASTDGGNGGNGGNGGAGGAIFSENVLKLSQCYFINNGSGSGGNGNYGGSTLWMTDGGDGGNGGEAGRAGAVYLSATPATSSITNCSFEGNFIGIGGDGDDGGDGGDYYTFFAVGPGNGGDGGNAGKAREGSAVYFSNSDQDIASCLFVENQNGTNGSIGLGGVRGAHPGFDDGLDGSDGSMPTVGGYVFRANVLSATFITGSIFWNNKDNAGNPLSDGISTATTITLEYSIAQNDVTDFGSPVGVIDIDPLFTDESSGNYNLSLCSPVVDAGNPSYTTTNSRDILNNERIVGIIDLGPMETQAPIILEVSNGTSNDVEIQWTYPENLRDQIEEFNIHLDGETPGTYVSTAGGWPKTSSTPLGESGIFENFCLAVRESCGTPIISCVPGRKKAEGKISGTVTTPGAAGVPDVKITATPADRSSYEFASFDVVRLNDIDINMDELTVEAWVKLNSYTSLGGAIIIENLGVFLMGINETGKLQIGLGDGIGSYEVLKTYFGQTIPLGEWTHVAFRYAEASGQLDVLVNGEQVTSYSTSASLGLVSANDKLYFIGRRATGNGMKGYIDEVRIWNEYRSEADIDADMYSILKGDEANLVSYYPLEDDVIDGTLTVFDYIQGSSNHGSTESSLVGGGVLASLDIPSALGYCSTTDLEGDYVLTELPYLDGGSSYTVVPSLEGHFFDPSQKNRTLNEINSGSAIGVDFADTTIFTISGYVTFPGMGSLGVDCGVDSVYIDVPGSLPPSFTYTDESGFWSIGVQETGTYTVTPSIDDHEFDLSSQTVVVDQDVENVNFSDTTTRRLAMSLRGGCSNLVATEVKFSIQNTTGTSGCFSIEDTVTPGGLILLVSPMEYTISVTEIDPVDTDVTDQLIDIDVDLRSTDDTAQFVYHQPPDINVTSSWDTKQILDLGCSGSVIDSFLLVEQVVPYFVTLEVTEFYPAGSFGSASDVQCAVQPADSAYIDINDPASEILGERVSIDVNGLAYYIHQPTEISLATGTSEPDYSFPLVFTAVVDAESASWNHNVVVEGYRQDAATFTTVTPELPKLVLRDPPGDNSYSYFEENSAVCFTTGYQTDTSTSLGGTIDLQLGVAFSVATGVGISVSKDFAFYRNFSIDWLNGTRNVRSTEQQTCVQANSTIQTSDSDDDPGDGSTLVYGYAQNILYSVADHVFFDDANCGVNQDRQLIIAPDSITSEYLYTTRFIEEDVIPSLELIRDSYPLDDSSGIAVLSDDALKTANQIDVWEQVIDQVDSLAEVALDDGSNNYSFIGGGTVLDVSTENSSSETTSVSYDTYYDLATLSGLGFEVSGTGLYGGVRTTVNTTTSSDTIINVDTTTTIGFVFEDDDLGDNWSTNVAVDPVYGTPVFEVIAGESSCPHEANTVMRDNVQFTIDETFITTSATDENFTLTVTNISTVSTDDDRSFYIALDNSTNPDGASLSIGGAAPNTPFLVNIDSGETVLANLNVSHGATAAYTFDDLKLVVFAACDLVLWNGGLPIQELGAVTFSIHFDPPCVNPTLFAPEDLWLVNAMDGDNLLVTLTDFDAANVDDIDVQYQLLPFGNWTTFYTVTAIDLASAGTFYDYNWDVTSLPDGDYRIRAKNNCTAGGYTYTEIASGTIDRGSSQVVSTTAPDGGSLLFGESPDALFNSNLFCGTVNASKVNAYFADGGASIGLLDPICSGTTITIPIDYSATAECSLENQWVTFEIFDIIDEYGNDIDTVRWTFMIDRYDDPVAIFTTADPSTVGGSDGAIVLNLSGGAAPYTVVWEYEGSAFSTGLDTTVQNLSDIFALISAGVYVVTITDQNCSVTTDSVELYDPSTCDIATAPTGLSSTIVGSNVVLSWTPVPQSVGCQLQGTLLPSGPSGTSTVPGYEIGSKSIPYAFLGAGTTWEWAVRCACQVIPTVEATPFSNTNQFTVPSLRITQEDAQIRIHPNPVQSRVRVRLMDFEAGETSVRIVDLAGRVLFEKLFDLEMDDYTLEITEVANLAPGMYNIVVDGSMRISEAFVKIE